MKSILIPTIGAECHRIQLGALVFSMIKLAKQFYSRRLNTCLKAICFIVPATDEKIYQIFIKSMTKANIEMEKAKKKAAENLKKQAVAIDLSNESSYRYGVVDCQSELKILLDAACSNDQLSCRFCLGQIQLANAACVINPTCLCSDHQRYLYLTQKLESSDENHCLASLNLYRNDQYNTKQYQVCPYGLITDFQALLTIINADGNTSVSIALSSTELSADDIRLLIDAISQFVSNHQESDIHLKCIDFITGNQCLASEIAYWAYKRFMDCSKEDWPFPVKWHIPKPCPYLLQSKKITLTASNPQRIEDFISQLHQYAPDWTDIELDDEYCSGLDESNWLKLAYDIWCRCGTLIVRNNTSGQVRIHGYKEDIMIAYKEIHEKALSHPSVSQDAMKLVANNVLWITYNDNNEANLSDLEVNYRLEMGYKAYLTDKTKYKIALHGNWINYDNMTIQDQNKKPLQIVRKLAQIGILYVNLDDLS